MADTSDDRLYSWKGIATYLGRNERTAMRWAQRLGLPVHRTPGTRHGSVFAYKHEVDAWLAGPGALVEGYGAPPVGETKEVGAPAGPAAIPAPSRRRCRLYRDIWLAVAAASLGALTVLLAASLSSSRQPHADPQGGGVNRVTFTSDSVVAWDGNRELWQHRFARPLDPGPLTWGDTLQDFVRIVRVSRPPRTFVIIVGSFWLRPNPDGPFEMPVYCFSGDGRLLWSYVPHETFQFGTNEIEGPWRIGALYISNANGRPKVWVAENHHIWGNSFVVELDAETGKAKLRFVNTGVLYALSEAETESGSYLLAGGFNNEYSAGILAVIDERKAFAASPQTPGTRHFCVSCPSGSPEEYFVFPRTEINRVEGVYEDPIRAIRVYGNRADVHKAEANGRTDANAVYLFRTSPSVWPISVRYDTSYDILYRHLELEGRIRSSLDDSPERLHPQPVAVWTPMHGWSECGFKPPGIASGEDVPISQPPRYFLAAAAEH